jgi:hypothetical protein
MMHFAQTLWDLLAGPRGKRRVVEAELAVPKPPVVESAPAPRRPRTAQPAPSSMQERYDAVVREMKQTYGIRVRRWRTGSSGVAWIIRYDTGEERRLIESPYPRGPMSCAIFLHEVGHHAIGFGTYRPRCLEEYHAWKWSLDAMRRRGLNVTEAVERRVRRSLRYAIDKARRRGLGRVPDELLPYVNAER